MTFVPSNISFFKAWRGRRVLIERRVIAPRSVATPASPAEISTACISRGLIAAEVAKTLRHGGASQFPKSWWSDDAQ